MYRIFLNPLELKQIILQRRLHNIEPLARVETIRGPLEIDGHIYDGQYVHYALFESTQTDGEIAALLASEQTAEETEIIDQFIAISHQIRDEYIATMAMLQTIQNTANPTTGEVIAAVKFEAKTLERLLKLLKMQFT